MAQSSKLSFFFGIDEFFELIGPVIEKNKLKIFFRRFQTDKYPAGWKEVEDNFGKTYNTGGFSKIYFSLTKKPKNEQDWDFMDRAEDELLEITGGRESGKDKEIMEMRIIAKKSKMKPVYDKIKEIIKENSAGNKVLLNDSPYEIYYSKSEAGKNLKYKLEGSNIKVTMP